MNSHSGVSCSSGLSQWSRPVLRTPTEPVGVAPRRGPGEVRVYGLKRLRGYSTVVSDFTTRPQSARVPSDVRTPVHVTNTDKHQTGATGSGTLRGGGV